MRRWIISVASISIIIILAFLLRIYRIEELLYFSYDEAIPAFVGKRIFEQWHIPLIGGVTPFGLHLSPYFYWLSAIILFIGKFNPLIWGVASAIISIFTVLLFIIVGKEFFNKKVAFISASIWTFSYLAIIYDKHYWALFWSPLVALVTLLSLKKIIEGKHKYFYLLAVTLAFAIHTDLSNLIFLGLSALVLIFYKIPIKKEAIIAGFIMILSVLPIIVFDLRHNFANSLPALNYFVNSKKQANNPQNFWQNTYSFGQTFTRVIYPFSNSEIVSNYTYCKEHISARNSTVPILLSVISLFAILGFALTKGKRGSPRFLTLTLILYFIGIHSFGTIFKSDVFEHYFAGLLPVYIFIIAWLLSLLPKKIWILALSVFIVLNLIKLDNTYSNYGLSNKKQAIEYVSEEVENKPFSLESISTCWKYSGYRYLFSAYNVEPVKSYADPNLAYLYSTEVAEEHPNVVVAFITHDYLPEKKDFYEKYILYKSHEIKSKLFGSIEVIIMDNKSNWFE